MKLPNDRLCYFEFDVRMKWTIALLSAEQLLNTAFRIVKKAKHFCRLLKFCDDRDGGNSLQLVCQTNYGNSCYDTTFGDYTYEQASHFRFHC